MDPWRIAVDERVKHDGQFATLTQGSHVTGEQARSFFIQSGLPQLVLGQIWGLADVTADGMMDRKEFSIAMALIKRKLLGYQLPASLPPSMLVEPNLGGTLPHGMTGMSGGFPAMPAMSSATLPTRLPGQPSTATSMGLLNAPNSPARTADSASSSDWAIPHANRLKYNQIFNREDRKRSGFLTGLDARALLVSSGIPQNLLAQIWTLADVDKDGRLSSEEFSLAMFFTEMVKMGQPLPMTLPPNFIPPSMRSKSRSNSSNQSAAAALGGPARPVDSFGDLVPGGFGIARVPVADNQPIEEPALLTPLTLEDKRRENFVKGNAELERRRAELRDQQRKEEEARQAKERAEQEKRDAVRREQEKKRLVEQERLMERQRQMEAEREEQRRKALEARESARKEMERQRQQEWERQRRQALLVEKKRHEEAVQLLESQVNNLKYEIETMDNKKQELITRIAEGKENVIRNTGYIDDMRSTRDSLISSVSAFESTKNEQERAFVRLCSEFNHVNQQLQNRQAENPISDNFKQQQNLHSTIKHQVEKLRETLSESDTNRTSLSSDVDVSKSSLTRLRSTIGELRKTHTQATERVKRRKSEWDSEKRRRSDEKIRANNELRMKEEAEKQKQMEEERKKKEEDKWSVFKGLDFGAPVATASVPGNELSTDNWASTGDWGAGSALPAIDNKPADLWASQPTSTPADLWTNSATTTTPSAMASSDLFSPADGGWSKPPNETKTTAILPPPAKTPQKKEPASGSEPVTRNRKVEIYEVLYDFEARNEDELDLTTDDKIKVYPDEQESAEPGWLSGWKGDRAGIFPANYVVKQREVFEPVVSSSASSVKSADASGTQSAPPSGITKSPSAFEVRSSSPHLDTGSPAPAGLTCVAIYQWRAKKDNHLSFNQGDEIKVLQQQDLWWNGSLASGEHGWFPKSHVKTVDRATSSPHTSSAAFAPADTSRLYDQVPEPEPPAPSKVPSKVPTQPTPAVPEESANSRLYDQVPEDIYGVINKPAKPQAERFVALHDYQSDVEGDLVFSAGELILVTSKESSEWWTGQIGGRSGIFPANYVGTNDAGANDAGAASLAPQAASVSSAPAVGAAASAPSSQMKEIGKVIAAYEATGMEQLSLRPGQLIQIRKKSPSGWWEGELMAKGQKKQIGWFPKDYIKLLPSKSADRPSTPASDIESPRSKQATPTPAPQVVTPPQAKVQASYPYTAQNDDELCFEAGDIITIVDKNDPDWWTGLLNGATGVFPANYVQHYTEPLSGEEKKRQQAIEELINTEETYVKDMNIALEAFYRPLKGCNLIPESELDAIFVNWGELIHCNRKLDNAFKVRRKTCGRDEPINVIGDVLVENFPNMTPYIRFCSRQLYAAQLLQRRVETDSEARQFISKCQQDPRVHGMPLSSYILKPMQRITKYPLLVNRIMNHTTEDHPDHQYISEAYAKAQELANQVNEGVKEEDNSDKLEWVQNHVSCEGLAENITFNSLTNSLGQRKFIYSGVLSKMRSGRELYSFLFNDFLLFTTPVSNGSTEKVFQLDVKGIIYKMYKTPVFLNEVSVREPVGLEKPDTENVCFQLCHIENIIDIKCTTTTERNAWIKRLSTATEAALSLERVRRERAMSVRARSTRKSIGRILVIISEGIDLLASDANGKSDPYCEVSMGSAMHKTKVIANTLNPKWNANMQFAIKSVEDDVLCFTVFDQDRFSPNDFLGRTELRVKDILKETREKRGPILKYAKLQEVNTGEVVVKLDLQLYKTQAPVPSLRVNK